MTLTTTSRPSIEMMARPEITTEHAALYDENGYLALPDALTPDEVRSLRDETVRICRGELGAVAGLPPVASGDSDEEVIQLFRRLFSSTWLSALSAAFRCSPRYSL